MLWHWASGGATAHVTSASPVSAQPRVNRYWAMILLAHRYHTAEQRYTPARTNVSLRLLNSFALAS